MKSTHTTYLEQQTDTEKKASNFELNRIKLGKHDIQLSVGDRFVTNGSHFSYQPCKDSDGKKVLVYKNYNRPTMVSAKKYEKDVLKADNIELVVDRWLYDGTEEQMRAEIEKRKHENWQPSRYREYEVKYVYQQPAASERIENLICLYLIDGQSGIEFKSTELKVERETKECFFLKDNQPISHHTKIEKKTINEVISPETYHFHVSTKRLIMCRIEDYHEAHTKLFAAYEAMVNNHLRGYEQQVLRQKERITTFVKLKQEQGL